MADEKLERAVRDAEQRVIHLGILFNVDPLEFLLDAAKRYTTEELYFALFGKEMPK